MASLLFAASSILFNCFSRRFSRSSIWACKSSLLIFVVLRLEALLGASAAVGIHDARSDFFFGRGGVALAVEGTVGLTFTFFWKLLGI
jgi:hypothetical protein